MKNLNWKLFLPGIRTKLSLFTILFVVLIISVMSQFFIIEQKKALAESYEKELASSKEYIGSVVSDLEGISRSLVLIEEFRDHVKDNQRILAANKKTYFVEENKLFGFIKMKNDLINKN